MTDPLRIDRPANLHTERRAPAGELRHACLHARTVGADPARGPIRIRRLEAEFDG